jgi:hypothetical protein
VNPLIDAAPNMALAAMEYRRTAIHTQPFGG